MRLAPCLNHIPDEYLTRRAPAKDYHVAYRLSLSNEWLQIEGCAFVIITQSQHPGQQGLRRRRKAESL